MRQWQRWGLTAVAVVTIGALLWTARNRRVPAPPVRPTAGQPLAARALAAPDAVGFRVPDPVGPALSVSFLDASRLPGRGRLQGGGSGYARLPLVVAERLRVGSLPGPGRTVPEPTHLLWAGLAILAAAARRRL